MHYNASDSPAPLGKNYNTEYVQAITREAERVNAQRGPSRKKLKVLPWVWYRYIFDHVTLLEPADIHTALAGPGLAGADGVLFCESTMQ